MNELIEKLDDKIAEALQAAKELATAHPSREVSLIITKLEEAEMWSDKAYAENWQKENDYNFNVSVGFKTTLWDGGKILNEIRRAASQSESARIQTPSVRQQIEQKVRENHLKLTMTVEKLQNQQEKTETLTQRKLLNAQLAEAGLQGRQQTLIAEIEVLASQIEEEQLKINLSQYITILKALT